VCSPPKFWITPPATSASAATNAIGSRIRTIPRTRSTQKLPIESACRLANPRTSAIATAMPTAAETKFCTARPPVCTRCPIVDSPPAYACQLVLVTKLTAVFQAVAGATGPLPRLSGRWLCSRCRPYRNRIDIAENASTPRA
jgi:hypothetical protein